MSYVMAVPELMEAAATDIATIGDTITAAHMAAAAPTGAVLPAAADEVSAGIADLMSGYGQEYQALAGQAAAFQEQFAQALKASADAYADAEATNAALLQPLTAIADAPASAAASPGEELGSLVVQNLFDGFLIIFIGIPVLLLIVGIAIVNPNLLRGLAALINGRG